MGLLQFDMQIDIKAILTPLQLNDYIVILWGDGNASKWLEENILFFRHKK